MIKYQIELYTWCDGWVNCESDGDGNKIYYETAEEAQASINDCVEEWNEEVDNGTNELGDHYDVDDYRVVKVNIDERLDVLQEIKDICKMNRKVDWTDKDPSDKFKAILDMIEKQGIEEVEVEQKIIPIKQDTKCFGRHS
jgi:hypothetical protein